jgi:cyclohexa-1,5-dienecarbonyl-CoA hydratase
MTATTTATPDRSVTAACDGATARVVLNRPPLNILDLPAIQELSSVLESLSREPALRALVISAEGKAFSAGVAVQDHLPERAWGMLSAFHGIFRRLWLFPCPTLAVVNGPALGGGCELACFADLVVASDTATFGLPETRLGVFPPVAAAHFPQRIGAARTLQLILAGGTLSAREALAIGLVDEVVPPDALAAAAESAVGRWRDKSAPVLRLARRAVQCAGPDFETALDRAERLFLDELMKTADAAEGLRAFLEKRPPSWSHR